MVRILEDDWNQWASSHVTKAYISYLRDTASTALNKIVNADPGLDKDSLEEYAIKVLVLRSFMDGIGQASDLSSIAEELVSLSPKEEATHAY